jgi:1,6-anhydro-N-acetylmuramate kinase
MQSRGAGAPLLPKASKADLGDKTVENRAF